MKPVGSAQGKGIFLFRNLKDINRWRSENRWKSENPDVEAYVVQRYINNPFLVGGKKFDMRIYALVSSFTPLTVWLYRGGFARFSATKYSGVSVDNIGNNQMHLTNVAVQKQAENYDPESGNKWDLRDLKLYLLSRFGVATVDKLFREIQNIVLRSLMSVENVMINDKHCFELYGYDILFDENLKPWLIEVNASPSLSANTREDYNMKYSMLNDMFDIVDMEKRRPGGEEHIGGFDLIHKGSQGLEEPAEKTIYTTYLGCDVPERDFEAALERHRNAALPKKSQMAGPKGIRVDSANATEQLKTKR
jgi:tubulin polyglutamylase TTLL9